MEFIIKIIDITYCPNIPHTQIEHNETLRYLGVGLNSPRQLTSTSFRKLWAHLKWLRKLKQL